MENSYGLIFEEPFFCTSPLYRGYPYQVSVLERLFSIARRVITRDRNRLDPNTVGQILYIKSNLDWYETYLKEHRFDEILNIKY